MGLTRKRVLALMGAAAAGSAAGLGGQAAQASPEGRGTGAEFPGTHVIRRDVCVIGGGSAGTYTAVRLGDLGQSVVVVEAKGRLGGHTETYRDPATGTPVNAGVVVFEDEPLVRAYFDRFGVALTSLRGGGGGTTTYVDFRTGRPVGYTPPAPVALPAYHDFIGRYGPIDTVLDLPDPVPHDLVAPFAEFAAKYGFGSVVPLVFNYGQGIGDVLGLPALYAINTFGLGVSGNILARSFLTAQAGDNSLLYARASAHLGEDVLLDSQVLRVDRDRDGVRVLVDTLDGPRLIVARKLVFTGPPLLRNFAGFDLDAAERSIFAQFISGSYYTSQVHLSGLPAGVGLGNVAADTPYNLPPLPGIYGVNPTAVPGLYSVKYGSPAPLPDIVVRRNIRAGLERVAKAGTYPVVFEEFAFYSSHTPFELHVRPSAIEGGFYRRLNGLQGRNHTFYAGAALASHNSTRIWTAIEGLLPKISA